VKNDVTSDSSLEMHDVDFIRHKLYGGKQSAISRYSRLVLARPSPLRLIFYEFLITMIGPIPGAVGLFSRKFLYPFILGTSGSGVVFGRSITLRHPENIHLGDGVVLDDYCLLDARGAGEIGITLGDQVMINRGAMLQAKVGEICIGKGSSIGSYVSIISQGAIYIDENVSVAGGSTIAGGRYVVELSSSDSSIKKRRSYGNISIGKNTRIGMAVIIQDGVEIGEGAIVAPGSVVLSRVGDFSVVSGSPAKPWRAREVNTDNQHHDSVQVKSADVNSEFLAQHIRKYLENTVFVSFVDDNLSDTDSFLDNNILDSVGFASMSSWLEQEFNISILDDEVLPENMDSIDNLVGFISRKLYRNKESI